MGSKWILIRPRNGFQGATQVHNKMMLIGADTPKSALLAANGNPLPSAQMAALRFARQIGLISAMLIPALGACASSANTTSEPGDASSALTISKLKVSQVQGDATVQSGNRIEPLEQGMTLQTGQPIQLSDNARAALNLARDALFELGPKSRLIALELPGHGNLGRNTDFRLESGHLRVILADHALSTELPLGISLGSWVAQIQPGEYFLESRGEDITACVSRGSLHLGGAEAVESDIPAGACLRLSPLEPPRRYAMTQTHWETLRKTQNLDLALKMLKADQIVPQVTARDPSIKVSGSQAKRSAPNGAAEEVSPETEQPARQQVGAVKQTPAPARPEEQSVSDLSQTAEMVGSEAQVQTSGLGSQNPAEFPVLAPLQQKEALDTVKVPPRPASLAASPPQAAAEVRLPPGVSPVNRATETPLTSAAIFRQHWGAAHEAQTTGPIPPVQNAETEFSTNPPVIPQGPVPPQAPNGEWIVNVSSHSLPEDANAQIAALEKAGYVASLRTEIVRGLNSYRVVIAGIESEETANASAEDLKAQHGMSSAWVLRVR